MIKNKSISENGIICKMKLSIKKIIYIKVTGRWSRCNIFSVCLLNNSRMQLYSKQGYATLIIHLLIFISEGNSHVYIYFHSSKLIDHS